jgi:hypothetical protein
MVPTLLSKAAPVILHVFAFMDEGVGVRMTSNAECRAHSLGCSLLLFLCRPIAHLAQFSAHPCRPLRYMVLLLVRHLILSSPHGSPMLAPNQSLAGAN